MAEEEAPTLPPQNIQAESSLLGSILLEADAITKIADTVGADLYEKRQPIDVLTLTDKLESSGVIDDVGGAGYITELSNSVPSAAHVHYYGDIVSKKATLRRLITAAGEITQLGYSGSDDTDELLDKAEQLLYNVSEHNLRGIVRTPASGPPAGVPTGDNVCDQHQDYYKNTSITLQDGRDTFDAWLTNYSLPGQDCQLSYVTFDFNGDTHHNWSGNVSYSSERVWQHDDVITINNASYRIDLDREEFDLVRNASNTVGTVIQNTAVNGAGTVTVMRNVSNGDDVYAVLKAVFLRGSHTPRSVGGDTAIPETTASYSVYTASRGEVYIPVKADLTWWYR
ncbi:hypothetical protein BRC21_00035 [Candidatus Saccharibacteria bacterium SW_7_54_9]|nr:MAG: hypothetical protein BRC21_00035 [Candidatus Saccharibacteria bacterium SW_7_54_9]